MKTVSPQTHLPSIISSQLRSKQPGLLLSSLAWIFRKYDKEEERMGLEKSGRLSLLPQAWNPGFSEAEAGETQSKACMGYRARASPA